MWTWRAVDGFHRRHTGGDERGRLALGFLFDEAANAEQLDRLAAVHGGEYGGVPAALGPLIGEIIGEVVAPIRLPG